MKNLFCDKGTLGNEASVEQFFVNRLLQWLGYDDASILPKTSIEEVVIARGSKKLKYKPDYIMLGKKRPRWICDAKSTEEEIEDWVEQCASYCLHLNRHAKKGDGVRYFMITNGLKTGVWEWDRSTPVLNLSFSDFVKDNPKLRALVELLGPSAVSGWSAAASTASTVSFKRPSPASINSIFVACNNYIYKHDNLSQAAAFHEFVKVVFLKIRADRELHRRFPAQMAAGEPIPVSEVPFSTHWIDGLAGHHSNPLDVQFQELFDSLENEVAAGSKKRIFDKGEKLLLQPDTAKAVVGMLENQDLFGIDEDLNGRLFETFLNSTMRGRGLGQYFTPRSVVKLMVGLADLHATRDHLDIVMDPCCGTGGFLIEALAVMSQQVEENHSLSGAERNRLLKRIREDGVYGIDVGREPPIARIARINMYLHGDGGSRIYIAEALDKEMIHQGHLSPEHSAEIRELRGVLLGSNPGFDVVITNPPFSKEYDPKVPSEGEILKSYDVRALLGKQSSIRSSILFLERYADLLKPGGRALAVVDDSVLGGSKWKTVRNYIREHFIVRAVVSLPGDAFQRSGARVKTSVIYLVKREVNDVQGDVFMDYCTSVGVDDSARQRVLADDAVRRDAARKEIGDIVQAFHKAQLGTEKTHLVPAARIADRLDVKSCLLKPGRRISDWKKSGLDVGLLSRWATLREEETDTGPDEAVRLLSVSYDGFPEWQEPTIREEVDYGHLYVAHTGDIVVSHINAVNGAIGVLPKEMDGALVSPEYTVLTPKEGVDPHSVWSILRSPEVRAELLTRSSGLGRHRIQAPLLLDELVIPSPTTKDVVDKAKGFHQALKLEADAKKLRHEAQEYVEESLELASRAADNIIAAFKPPR